MDLMRECSWCRCLRPESKLIMDRPAQWICSDVKGCGKRRAERKITEKWDRENFRPYADYFMAAAHRRQTLALDAPQNKA